MTVTLTDAAGNSLTKDETGTLCPTSNEFIVRFSGSYSVTGGTGRYAGASGGGIVTMTIAVVPRGTSSFTSEEVGLLSVPGVATAASKRTFRMRGTIEAPRRGARRPAPKAAAR